MRTPLAARPTSLRLAGGNAAKSLIQIDDKGAMTSKPLPRGASVPLNLTDKMTLVEISGPSAARR